MGTHQLIHLEFNKEYDKLSKENSSFKTYCGDKSLIELEIVRFLLVLIENEQNVEMVKRSFQERKGNEEEIKKEIETDEIIFSEEAAIDSKIFAEYFRKINCNY